MEEINTSEGQVVEDATPLSAEEIDMKTNIVNKSPKLVSKIDQHFWAGRPITSVIRIGSGMGGYSVQRGKKDEGIKFGICYADGEDTTARKWVVAFNSKDKKAYAEAGPIGPIDWNVVEVKLDQYSTDKAVYEDKILGGKCSAEIGTEYDKATFE